MRNAGLDELQAGINIARRNINSLRYENQIRSDQSLIHVQFFATPWIAAHQASLSITNSRISLRLTSIESVMPSSHLILCRPLLLLPAIPPSIRVFSNESTLRRRWPKYWSCSFSIIPSKEIPGLISFRMDWLDLLAVQGTLKSLFQHHSSKASILRRSAFFTVQLSHPYMTTGKTIALMRQTFAGKIMSLLLTMLSRGEPTIKFLVRGAWASHSHRWGLEPQLHHMLSGWIQVGFPALLKLLFYLKKGSNNASFTRLLLEWINVGYKRPRRWLDA